MLCNDSTMIAHTTPMAHGPSQSAQAMVNLSFLEFPT